MLPPKERQRVVGGEVADPSLEGGQVATLPLHAASVVPRDEGSILLPEGDVCTPWHKTRQSTKEAPNFRERRKSEVRGVLRWDQATSARRTTLLVSRLAEDFSALV